MRTTRHPTHVLVQLLGKGLVLGSLFGCLTLPTESVVGVEATAYHDDWRYRDDWRNREYQDHRRYRDPWERDPWGRQYDRSYQRPGHTLPDRYIIRKGKKCEVRCERIWGTRDYRCREYRC